MLLCLSYQTFANAENLYYNQKYSMEVFDFDIHNPTMQEKVNNHEKIQNLSQSPSTPRYILCVHMGVCVCVCVCKLEDAN